MAELNAKHVVESFEGTWQAGLLFADLCRFTEAGHPEDESHHNTSGVPRFYFICAPVLCPK